MSGNNVMAQLTDDPLLSVPKFGELCGGLSPWTIYSYLQKGLIKRTKVMGRTMVRASEAAKLIREE